MGFASLYPSYFFVAFCQKVARMSGAISGAAPDGRDAPAYRPLMRATTVEAVSRRVVDGEILTHTRGHS